TFINFIRSAADDLQLFVQFATGGGPTTRYFGPTSIESQNIASDPLFWSNARIAAQTGSPKFVAFGAPGFVRATIPLMNPTRHFVGGYSVQVINGQLYAVNQTSLRSLLYDSPYVPAPDRRPNRLTPFGNTYQIFDIGPYAPTD